jgi:hypothetical protein
MVVSGVITRLVRGGVLVDIQLESGEPAFVPLSEIPAKAMPRVRQLQEQAAMQDVRIIQLDRASGTATASLQGLLKGLPEADGGAPAETAARAQTRAASPATPAPEPAPAPPPPPRKPTAGERARRQQEEILRRMRGDA